MQSQSSVPADRYAIVGQTDEVAGSSVAWAAVIGGALAATSLSVILLVLGSGLGLSAVSPWPNSGATVTHVAVTAVIWLIVVQWLSSGLGGYLTGRLRTRWAGVHDHEVHFRDTANGFLAWALATVLSAAVLASGASSLIGGAAQGAARIAAGAAQGAGQGATSGGVSLRDPAAYFVDSLYRSDSPNATASPQEVRAETSRILVTGFEEGDVSAPDKAYLAKIVAARTGLSQADAEKRVNEVIAKAKEADIKARQAADAARKAAARLALFMAFAMVIGAFIATAAGALGGHHRDEWRVRLTR